MNYETTSEEIKLKFMEYMGTIDNAEMSAQEVFEGLIDELILGITFDVHHEAKCGLIECDEIQSKEDESFNIDHLDIDSEIFGHHALKKKKFCTCPLCNRSLGPSRFTRHLETCIKKRRNNRGASSRLANNTKDSAIYCGMKSDDDNDSDWTMSSDRNRRKKKEVNCSKKSRKPKIRTETIENDSSSSTIEYEGMSYEEKRVLFTQVCGVISENTHKLCNRSIRCPQHTDEQRRSVRAMILQTENNGLVLDMPVDVDTVEESAVWEDQRSNTSSPADSSTSSSSSKKRQKNNSKNYKNSPTFTNSNHLFLE